MKKETLFISFGTQKGGVGKSAFTAIVASYLHYSKKCNVAIIDCDYPQFTINGLRDRELEIIEKNEDLKYALFNQIEETGQRGYPVIKSLPEKALNYAYELIEKSSKELDFIFFDIAGTINNDGVLKIISELDYIFIPMSADRNVLESTLQYATIINEDFITTGKTRNKGFYLFWNMVDGRERSSLYNAYENAISELGLSMLNTYIPNRLIFRKEIGMDNNRKFRTTLFAPEKELVQDCNIEALANEITKIINSSNN